MFDRFVLAEYIWLDGMKPTPKFRSKTRVLPYKTDKFPIWSYDGSSTNQADGKDSDVRLIPCEMYRDPLRHTEKDRLVLCNVPTVDVPNNIQNFRVGFEQEYFLSSIQGATPSLSYIPLAHQSQGPFYCGVSPEFIAPRQRDLVEQHLQLCLEAGIKLYGLNAEVAPNQWEFQTDSQEPNKACSDLLMARYLLERLAEQRGLAVVFAPKPYQGDWNGSGCHTNFSYTNMDFDDIGLKFQRRHKEHIAVYGEGNNQRLTGKHETCSINEFRWGRADRTASLRIPPDQNYMEDRRPAANADPYLVVSRILQTLSGE